jgi:hypothetical protein
MLLPQIGNMSNCGIERDNCPANQPLAGKACTPARILMTPHLAGNMLIVAEIGLLFTFAHFYGSRA